MKAAVYGSQGLEIRELAKPQVKAGQLLVRVRYAGLNRRELTRMKGDEGTVPGLELAGEVAEVGADVKGFKPGDRVMALGGASYAEYAVAEAGQTLPLPRGVSLEQAATLPVALMTMHDAVVTNGGLRQGEAVLVQGASSGVGLMALQIAKLKGAGLVAGSSRNAAARLKEFGADLAVNTNDADWVQSLTKATGGKGVDLVIDQVSGKIFNQTQQATAIGGRIVNVGRLGGMVAEFDFNLHALRRLRYIGVTFRTRSAEEVREIARKAQADLWPALEAGKLRLPVDRVFPLEEADAAQQHMRTNSHFGKILLRTD
jgi:NADPH:quinone reductase-like Zn-dependent oxidoreductase